MQSTSTYSGVQKYLLIIACTIKLYTKVDAQVFWADGISVLM